jgi:hypothetical protein
MIDFIGQQFFFVHGKHGKRGKFFIGIVALRDGMARGLKSSATVPVV